MIKVTLKDGSVREFENELSVMDIAKSISEGLARAVVAASVNGKVVGLNHIVKEDCELNLFKFDDEEGKDVFRHTSAHILAQAIKRLYPEAKFAIGPTVENGFYYDIDLDHRLTNEDLEKLEKEMKKIAKEDIAVERYELPREEALAWAKENNEIYKVELIEDLPEGEVISFYKQGDFTDLCRGPHLPSTKKVKAVKLLSVAGAYWRGDEKNKMLQRIYGISFEKNKDLEEYLHMLEEAKKRGTLPYFVRDNQKRIGSILDYTPTSTFTVYKIAGIEQLSVLDGSNYDLTKAVSDVESNIRQNKSYETGVLFNKDGNIVIDKRGRSRIVQFTKDECLLMNDGIFTHNHPGAWGYAENDIMRIGNSFSIQDIALAVGNNLAEMRAVTPNYTFSMKRPDGGWGISVEELMILYNDENRNLRLEFTRRINKGTLTISQASATHFHILWKRLSKKLGFDYSKMKTK